MTAVAEGEHAALDAGDELLLGRALAMRFRLGALGERRGDLIGHAIAKRDVGQQFFEALEFCVGEIAVERLQRNRIEHHALRFERAIEHAVAERNGLLMLQML